MSFDPAVRKSSLASRNRAQSSMSSGSAEISALSAVSTLFSSVASFMRPGNALPLPSTPGPNLHSKPTSPPVNTSPAVFNTPSKLERFLRAAEQNGIPGVVSFHPMLSEKGYGPDIMHLVSVGDLGNIGMAPGDAIRLREYASKWWTDERRRATKRARDTDTVAGNLTRARPPASESTPPSKKMRFEKRYNDGGAHTLYGPAVKLGSLDDDVDYIWWIYSNDLKMYIPLPMGKVPVIEGEE